MDHDDRMLLCCICKDLLRRPIQLSCFHNCCTKCMDDSIGTDGPKSITCPVCADVTAVPPRNPNTFIEFLLNTSAASAHLRSCWFCAEDGCPNVKADAWCHHCKKNLCADCMPGHSKYNKEHVTTSLENVGSSKLPASAPAQQCQLHAKVLDHACLSCAVPQCTDCGLMCVQEKHNVQLLGSPESNAFVKKIKDTISCLQSALESMSHALQERKNLVNDVKAERDAHIHELEKKKRALLDTIDETFRDAKTAVHHCFDILDAKASELASTAEQSDKKLCNALEYSRILAGAGDITYLLQQQKALLTLMEKLVQGRDQAKAPLEASKYVIMNSVQLVGSGEVIKAWLGTPTLVTDDLFCSEDQVQSRAAILRSTAQMADIQKLRKELEMEVEKGEREKEAAAKRLVAVEQLLQKEQGALKEDVERLTKEKEQDKSTIKSLEGEVRKSGQLLQEAAVAHEKELKNLTAQIQELQRKERSALSEVAELKAQLKKMEESRDEARRDLVEFTGRWVPDLGPASSTIKTPVECCDVAVSADGCRLLLAACERGLLECDMSGAELSRWRPAKETAKGWDEEVMAVEELQDGRVTVVLYWSECVALLRRAPAAAAAWVEEKRIMTGLSCIMTGLSWIGGGLLSAHADLVAVADSGPRLSLLSLSRGRELSRHERQYMIGGVAVTAEAVLTASCEGVELSDGREEWVVDAYSHDGQQLLWRQEQGQEVTDICAALSGHVLYMALPDSDTVTAVRAEDGSVIKTVLTSSSHIAERPWNLSVSGRGQGTVLAVLSSDERTVTVHRAKVIQ